MKFYLAFIISIFIFGCATSNNNITKTHKYSVNYATNGITITSSFYIENKPYIRNIKHEDVHKLISLKNIYNVGFDFYYIDNNMLTCSVEELKGRIKGFMKGNEMLGSSLKREHRISITIIENDFYSVNNDTEEINNEIFTHFLLPITSCTDKNTLWDDLFTNIYTIIHEVYHVEDVLEDITQSILSFEFSATKKSHCDFFRSVNFHSFPISLDWGWEGKYDSWSEHRKGYYSFHSELSKLISVNELNSGSVEHAKVLEWCER